MEAQEDKEIWRCPWCGGNLTVKSGESEQLRRNAFLHMLDEKDATKEEIMRELRAI